MGEFLVRVAGYINGQFYAENDQISLSDTQARPFRSRLRGISGNERFNGALVYTAMTASSFEASLAAGLLRDGVYFVGAAQVGEDIFLSHPLVYVVESGEAIQYSVLPGGSAEVAPQVVQGVAVSGEPVVGATIAIIPGTYSGIPVATLSREIKRGSASWQTLLGLTFSITEADVETTIQVRELAANAAGTISSLASLSVPLAPPLAISSIADRTYLIGGPAASIDLASKFSGSALTYSVQPVLAAIDISGAALTITPTEALATTAVTVMAQNDSGSAQHTFSLTINEAVSAPTAVTLSDASEFIEAGSGLPIPLAGLSADGTQPVTWSLVAGEPNFSIVGTQLRLVQMPALGQHTATVRATNGAGYAEAAFTLTVTAANQPPAISTIAAQTATVGESFSLDLSAYASDPDGSSLTYSATGLPAGLSLSGSVISGTPTAEANSTINVTVTDPGGHSASGSFGLTVAAAVVDPPAGEITTNIGTVSNVVTQPNGDMTFDVTGTEFDGTKTIPAAAIASGYPVILDMPPFSQSDSDADGKPEWTVTGPGLYAWPADAAGSPYPEWLASGAVVASNVNTYELAAGDEAKEHRLRVTVSNYNTVEDGVTVSEETVVKAVVAFAYAQFTTTTGRAEWDLANAANPIPNKADVNRMFMFARTKPDIGATADMRAAIMSFYGVPQGLKYSTQTSRMAQAYAHGTGGTYAQSTFADNDILDLIVGWNVNGAAAGASRKHVAAVRVNMGAWVVKEASLTNVVDLSAATLMKIGGRPSSFSPEAGVPQTWTRCAMWFNSVDPMTNLAAFFKGDGSLEHPDASITLLGTPAIDFYSKVPGDAPRNWGTWGQPTITGITA